MLEPWAMAHRRWKKWPIWHLMEKSNLRSASLIHATSDGEARSLRRLGLEAPIAVIANGVSIPPFAPSLGNRGGPCRAVFIGRIHPVKGLDRLLHAWQAVACSGWTLQIAGPDEMGHLEELQVLCRRLGVASQVTFRGAVDEAGKRELLESADLFVAPSHTENFGIAIAEALAHGVPVLTTQGTPWEVLDRIGAGWWTENSKDGIAQGLTSAISTTRDQLHQMGIRGRDLVQDRLGWAAIGAQFVDSYQWLLEGGAAPPWISLHGTR